MGRSVAAVAVSVAVAVAAASVATPVAQADAEPIYLPCFQPGHPSQPEGVPKQHPRNCWFSATFVSGSSAGLFLADYQQINWKGWGSPRAEGTAISVNSETHRRLRVRFVVWGKQTCEEATFYKTFLLKRPRTFNPQNLTGTIQCASEPELSGARRARNKLWQ